MQLPEPGDRIRSGAYATIVKVMPPNEVGNVRCIVVDDQGRLGWIMYYPTGTRSNVNRYRTDEAEALRAELAAEGLLEPLQEDES